MREPGACGFWSGGISIAGSLRIETFEGSRPHSRLWVLNGFSEAGYVVCGASWRDGPAPWSFAGGQVTEFRTKDRAFCLRFHRVGLEEAHYKRARRSTRMFRGCEPVRMCQPSFHVQQTSTGSVGQ
jgi:hypothetical protein